MDQTKVKVSLNTHVNMGNYEWCELYIEVEDYVRDVDDGKTGKAIDRIHGLVEKKLLEKIESYSPNDS